LRTNEKIYTEKMAILGQIQKRSGFLIMIIALALFAFVIQGLIKNAGSIGKGSRDSIAEVGGRKVSSKDFQKRVAIMQKNGGNRVSSMQAVKSVWNQVIKEAVLGNQFDELGIQVGADRLRELVLNDPNIKRSFTNQQGVFDENALLDYMQRIEDGKNSNPEAYEAWKNYERGLEESEKERIYFDMIKAGLVPSLKEGEWKYHFENDNVDFKYMAVPYTSIADSTVSVSKDEISAYVEKHKDLYEMKEGRDIEYVMIPLKPSEEDKNAIINDLKKLVEDKEVFDEKTKAKKTKQGFRNTKNAEEFVNKYSDEKRPPAYYFEKDLKNVGITKSIDSLSKGDIIGPYVSNDRIFLSKVLETKKVADSAKASHILIAYKGALRANPGISRTKEEAKKTADSLLRVVKANAAKFADYAKKMSDGPTKTKGGDLGWFTYGRMVPKFNDFIFNNRKGSIGMVETDFGYHIIKIFDKTNPEKTVKLATIVRNVEPSTKTENTIFANAVKFAEKALKADDFKKLAQENSYEVKPVRKLGRYDDQIPGLGVQREFIRWAYKKDTEVGDVSKFDLDNGYAVVRLVKKYDKGLMPAEEASRLVKPILLRQKKAELIKKKILGKNLDEMAKNSGGKIGVATGVTLANPTIPGYGREQKVVGKAFMLEADKLSEPVEGNVAVYVIKTTEVKKAADVKNYLPYVEKIKKEQQVRLNTKVIEALKKKNEIKDKRNLFY